MTFHSPEKKKKKRKRKERASVADADQHPDEPPFKKNQIPSRFVPQGFEKREEETLLSQLKINPKKHELWMIQMPYELATLASIKETSFELVDDSADGLVAKLHTNEGKVFDLSEEMGSMSSHLVVDALSPSGDRLRLPISKRMIVSGSIGAPKDPESQ